MGTEADTCRTLITPRLQAAGWDSDAFDLLCPLAFNALVLTRRQRADRLKKQQAAFFGYFAPEGRGRADCDRRCRALRLVAAEVCTMKKTTKTSLTQKAMQALTEAVAKVVEDHRQRGKPLAVWRNGEAVWMPVETADALRETPTHYKAKS